MGCNLEDDMEWLLRRMDEADAVVFAAPNYTMGPVGMVKMLSDRALQAVKYAASFHKKPTAVILTLGKEDYRGYSDTALNSQVRTLGLNVVALEHFYCTHPGEIAMADDFEQRVQGLADRLIAGTPSSRVSPDRCPRCFSDLFRARPEGLECAVCKALAKLENGSLSFFYYHPIFTDEGRKEHFEWLLMKKTEYSMIKERLREIQDSYREGVWISPDAADAPAAAAEG
jgi:multimeric flavodoxin WrbA